MDIKREDQNKKKTKIESLNWEGKKVIKKLIRLPNEECVLCVCIATTERILKMKNAHKVSSSLLKLAQRHQQEGTTKRGHKIASAAIESQH